MSEAPYEDTFLAFSTMFPRPQPQPDPTPQLEPEQSVITPRKLSTVADLIARLQELPGDMPVLTEDSESGYDDRMEMRTEDVELSWRKSRSTLEPYVSYHHGEYNKRPLPEGTEVVKMLVIG